MNNINEKKINIKEIAKEIFEGKITWSEACEKSEMAEKTLRKKIILLCSCDSELLKMVVTYKENRKKHDNINVTAVIITMIERQMSLSEMAGKLKISKESLRVLIKKEQDTMVVDVLKYHNEIMKQKRKRNVDEERYIEEKISDYKSKHEDYNDSLFYNKDRIEYETEQLKTELDKVKILREAGMSDKEISERFEWGPQKIRRMDLRYNKLSLIKTKQASENKIEMNER